jgi:hypothetical protein
MASGTLGPFAAGSDFTVDFTLVDEAGNAVGLAGGSASVKVERIVEQVVALTITDAAAGKCRWQVANAVSIKWPAGRFDGDVKATLSDSSVRYFPFQLRIWTPRGAG